MPDRHLTRLFLQRFTENDLISPDADRMQTISQACGILMSLVGIYRGLRRSTEVTRLR